MVGIMNKLLNWKDSNRLKILVSVIMSIMIILFYYILYFNNQIKDNYLVHDSKIDGVIKLTSSEEINLNISHPFDQLYLPLTFCNTDKVFLTVNDGNNIKNITISANTEKIVFVDKDEMDLSYFWDNFDYYCIEGIFLQPDMLQSDFVISLSFEGEDGFIVLGTSDNNVAYQIIKNTNANYIIFVLVSFVIVGGTAIVSFKLIRQPDILSTYTIIAVLLGSIYFMIFPPSCTNDSRTHIIAMYERVNSILGHSDWNEVDGNTNFTLYKNEDGFIIEEAMSNFLYCPSPDTKIYDETLYSLFIDLSNDDTITSSWHKDLSSVSAIVYLPYLITMLLGRILNMNLMFTLQVAKLVGFICYLFMIRFAIKLIPYGKDALAIFSLMPMMMQSMISVGYDLFCIGGSFIAFAYILKINNEKHTYTWKDAILIIFLSLILIPSKSGVYFACFAFLSFFTIVFPIIKRRPKYILSVGGVLLVIVGGLFFLKFEEIKSLVLLENEGRYSINDLFVDPIGICRFIILSIINDMDRTVQGMFGGRLGWDEVVAPWFIVISYIVLFLMACQEDDGLQVQIKEKLLCSTTVLLFVSGLYCIFLRETKIEHTFIHGVQGRYFIPLIPLIICIVKNQKLKVKYKNNILYTSLWFVSIVHVMQIMMIYLRR